MVFTIMKRVEEVMRIIEIPNAANAVWTKIPSVTPIAEIIPAVLPKDIPRDNT
jgi:hypothetical protein